MTKLIFIYGQAAAGKLTIARKLADLTNLPLFHNHLIVDAVAAVFPFGSESFVRLREQFWLDVIAEAVATGRSLIFTFAPEPTVDKNFPQRITELIERSGGEVIFVALIIGRAEQERRLVDQSRAAFGKLRDVDLLRELWPQMDACMSDMPKPHLSLNVETASAVENAVAISKLI